MSVAGAPRAARGRSRAPAGSFGVAAVGGIARVRALLVVGQVLGLAHLLAVGGIGLWSWAKIGLVTSLAAFRADVAITFPAATGFGVPPSGRDSCASAPVPMVLTIGFLWLAARGGRRAARSGPMHRPLASRPASRRSARGVPVASRGRARREPRDALVPTAPA